MGNPQSNEEAKYLAVKKAYADLGIEGEEFTKLMVNKDGYTQKISLLIIKFGSTREVSNVFKSIKYPDINNTYLFRPRTLRGLDDNGGWTRIEPDGSNLPERNKENRYEAWHINGHSLVLYSIGVVDYHNQGNITHYKEYIPAD